MRSWLNVWKGMPTISQIEMVGISRIDVGVFESDGGARTELEARRGILRLGIVVFEIDGPEARVDIFRVEMVVISEIGVVAFESDGRARTVLEARVETSQLDLVVVSRVNIVAFDID